MNDRLVFLLEDQKNQQIHFHEIFDDIGNVNYVTASSYEEGLEIINSSNYDYLRYFIDMKFPYEKSESSDSAGYYGAQFVDELRTIGIDPERIVMMSSIISLSDIQSCNDIGIDPSHIISKEKLTKKKIEELLNSV